MNGRKEAVSQIKEFLNSDESGLLITGTNQYKKHLLIMELLDCYYSGAQILFRINSMENIDYPSFNLLNYCPKAGEIVRIGNNFYTFDSLSAPTTWKKTFGRYDFSIVYPIDRFCCKSEIRAIHELFQSRYIKKTFFCSWTDCPEYDYNLLDKYYSRHVVYDAEEENLIYHKRVLKNSRNE